MRLSVIFNTDVMHEYFGQRARRATYRSVANSQGITDIISFAWGGIPMCHGAGGLSAMYRQGSVKIFLYFGLLNLLVTKACLPAVYTYFATPL